MSLTRQQIDSWNPASLSVLGDAWCMLASSVENLFERYVESVVKVEGEYWEGTTAEAVQDRAASDHRTAIALADRVEALALTMRQGYYAIDGPLRRARDLIAHAQEQCFVVTDGLVVHDPGSDPDREPARAALQEDLLVAAGAVQSADRDLEQALNTAREDLRIVFTAAAALGSEQGSRDAAALADGTLTPEAIRRLVEAGALTPEQLTGLRSGATVAVPASQMEYLNTISRSLDGLGPEQIDHLISTLPADARTAVANAMQLLSTETITVATGVDPEVPPRGGVDLLPDGIRALLTRDDLVTTTTQFAGGRLVDLIALDGVSESQAIARIVDAGDPQYRSGTALDRGLLDVGRQYLDAQVTYLQGERHQQIFTVDGVGTGDLALTEPIFAAVADDRAAVADAVSDPVHGENFVHDLLTHRWPDNGSVASAMFRFDEHESRITDFGNPVDVAAAHHSGAIMSAAASAMSSDASRSLLANIPGSDGQSIGQVNPELVRTVSHSMSPYIPHLAGAGASHTHLPGFDIVDRTHHGDERMWIDPAGNNQFTGSSNVFAALNTDAEAGTHFLGAAYAETVAAETRYAQDPYSLGQTGHLTTAGRILGLSDRGVLLATQDQYHDVASQQQEAYSRRAAAYDAARALSVFGLSSTPLGSAFEAAVYSGGDPLKQAFVGSTPDPEQQAVLTPPNFDDHYYIPLAAADAIPFGTEPRYAGFVDDTGKLLPYNELLALDIIDGDEQLLQTLLREMFNKFGDPADGHGTALSEGYSVVVRNDG